MIRVCTVALGMTSCSLVFACSSSAGDSAARVFSEAGANNETPGGAAAGEAGAADAAAAAPSDGGAPDTGGASVYAGTTELDVPVPDSGRVYVKLSGPSVVTAKTTADSSDWDLAFENYDVYTNSGPSGSGSGGAFGPLDIFTLQDDAPPLVPFISPDKAGGAFVDWYAYDGTSHALYSRLHVYGVKSGGQLWKAQVLSYYSEQDNAPVSALYRIRYAAIGATVGATHTLQIDGAAGGLGGAADAPSGCLDFASGTISKLTPDEASASKAWDLCFRRDSISVNGEVGGPRGVGAVDLQTSDTADVSEVEKETADGALPAFDAVTSASLSGAQFRGDHVVSAFETGAWLGSTSSPPAPAHSAWLVLAADGSQQFLLDFSEFRNATTSSPGTVVMHVKPVKR